MNRTRSTCHNLMEVWDCMSNHTTKDEPANQRDIRKVGPSSSVEIVVSLRASLIFHLIKIDRLLIGRTLTTANRNRLVLLQLIFGNLKSFDFRVTKTPLNYEHEELLFAETI